MCTIETYIEEEEGGKKKKKSMSNMYNLTIFFLKK